MCIYNCQLFCTKLIFRRETNISRKEFSKLIWWYLTKCRGCLQRIHVATRIQIGNTKLNSTTARTDKRLQVYPIQHCNRPLAYDVTSLNSALDEAKGTLNWPLSLSASKWDGRCPDYPIIGRDVYARGAYMRGRFHFLTSAMTANAKGLYLRKQF